MKAKLLIIAVIILVSLLLAGCGQRTVSFANDVQPILDIACLDCHTTEGEGMAASGLAVNDYDAVMKGTRFGPVVVAGSSISSTLYMTIAGKTDPEIQMPPFHDQAWAEGRGVPLTDEAIDTIALWIDQGAQNN